MKKRRIANIIMVVIILVIVAAGVVGVGYIQGWFDAADSQAVLTDIRGIVNIQRAGVAYPVEEETILRAGDRITCTPGATATIRLDQYSWLTVGQNAQVEIVDPSVESFAAEVSAGEAFAAASTIDLSREIKPITLRFHGKEVVIENAFASLSVRSGAQSVSVFNGVVGDAEQGQVMNWVGGELSVDTLSINSLNDFNITQLRIANAYDHSCFTTAQLEQLVADRRAEMQAQIDRTEPTEPAVTEPPVTEPPVTEPPVTEPPVTEPAVTEPPVTEPAVTEPPMTEPPVTEPPMTEPPATKPPMTEPKLTCTISIRCDTILNNWDDLDPAKAGFVPSDGMILYPVTVEFTEGETVFDVLNRACATYGIQIEYSWTPMYNSYYIEGINHLYEFDCGSESGWMYKVNGWFPNYGCSSYTLTGGENIVWCFTCNGLGADVGA